jgi:outer membrane protein assembly factor BamB
MEVVNMLKSGWLLLIVSFLLICAPLLSAPPTTKIEGGQDGPAPARPVYTPAGSDSAYAETSSRWLVPRSHVAATDLKIVWQFNLPLADNESLDQLLVFGNRLCGLSSRNYLVCLNRTDGNVMFSSSIAPAGLPLAGLESYQGELITIVGNKFVEINADFGTEQTSTNLACGVTCPIVRNNSFFYVAGSDKRIHVLKASNKVQVFEVAAENDSLITTVLADQEFVIFATELGNVICITADRPHKLWQFDAPDGGQLVRDSNSIYFACRNTNVYRLELSSGHLVWKYQTSAILDSAPQSGNKVVYQRIPDVGLIAVEKETGKLLWQLADGVGLLAESGNKAFLVTKAGILVAMDNAKAKQLYSIDIGQPVKYATNATDSKIYIADAKGRLTCLQPAQ